MSQPPLQLGSEYLQFAILHIAAQSRNVEMADPAPGRDCLGGGDDGAGGDAVTGVARGMG
jgi:hypothetical protein